MGSNKLLGADEVEVRRMRTHPKILLFPVFGGVLLIGIGAVASTRLPDNWPGWVLTVVWAVVVAGLVPLTVFPWLRWITTSYTLTNRRIITRKGILTRTGHDLPLTRISDVTHEKSLIDRLFGCGTLTLQTSADDPLELEDVPKVEQVQVELTDLLFGGNRVEQTGTDFG
ncbi:hypothetical protein HMPREF1531_00162 [Propionibacterium sp. oral taxon 192 str. F0372]|uniref:PH domain-containing protein n=1 Tax=Propionibacterium sp. oral taxon 192 TaxID=671222 RepID=UPI0003528B75|nr:PH domain-containing protein [Propionibacterium sp. oral taxon 192]EPH07113.1 hypothetical protein HMPREF1531_00162 [Propionibacterium sp. oral taxon 192 str. F0372]